MATYNLNRGFKYRNPFKNLFWLIVAIVDLAILMLLVKLWMYL